MDSEELNGNGKNQEAGLPPPPSLVPSNLVPELEPVKKNIILPMARRGNGSKGQKISLLTNHFGVKFNKPNGHFFHYSVAISYEDGRPVEAKGIGRKIIDKVQETYQTDLASKYFAYDGEKTLFTVGALPSNKLDFSVVLEDMPSSRNASQSDTNEADRKRTRRSNQSKKFMVEISYAAKIPMQAIASALQGKETEHLQDAIRVLDVILRQSAARQGCLLVRQSFFHNDVLNFVPIGGGVIGCRGFHSSFRTTQGGLSLNIDTSTTMIVQPGPVVDFLLANQNKKDPFSVDWNKARRTLKNLRVQVAPSNREYKISGVSEHKCKDQMFTWRKPKNEKGEVEEVEISVFNYYMERNIELRYSGDLPCINVGKPKRPTYIPIEFCDLVSLQRYTKSLTNFQRAALVEKSRQKPPERMALLTKGLKNSNYNADPVLQDSGVSIVPNFTQVEGRILPTPRLKVGNGEDLAPRNGRWNFNSKQLVEPTTVTKWAVVNFSARCDTRGLIRDLIRCGGMKGMNVDPPFGEVFEEKPQFRNLSANMRVEKMFELIQSKLPGPPQFLLCILSERKNSDVYGPWKKKNLSDLGIVTQCIAPTRVNDQYLTNVLLKINAKLGGLNSLLALERSPAMPSVTKVPTIIVGMDVSHGSPGMSDIPSIAAVVSSRQWPLISKYRACVRTQSRKVEMIDNLFKPIADKDEGIFRELLIDFYNSSEMRKPEHIIIFRDGVSESQFNQVLNIELDQMMQACKFLDPSWNPKFTVIVAQKNHHTKFFQSGKPDNVPPGTIIDSKICHPRNNDFYLCAHAGMIGTTRPTHYHVLYDEIGFATDDLQELVHSLSYVYQRSTTAISVVAPICYAHLAAAQMGTVMKFEDMSETSSSHGGITTPGAVPVPPMPKLNAKVASSMFFC
ncbi:Protein argonaute 9 [Cardamine amara subsp. amara]|uniref:Protein argonaute 9 n=1 Tax=Cardamine amara subsp. amara TaxID=228776 RepID=A0ABD1ABT8_CARAN